MYKGVRIAEYFGDLLVQDVVMVELKAHKTYNPEDEAQLLNELKASGLKVGLLINFGRDGVKFKRMVF
jgi:GxxExxY protein